MEKLRRLFRRTKREKPSTPKQSRKKWKFGSTSSPDYRALAVALAKEVEKFDECQDKNEVARLTVLLASYHGPADLTKGERMNLSFGLRVAAKDAPRATVTVLLNAGADVHSQGTEGKTALHNAAWAGNAEAVEVLLRFGANATARTYYGTTPYEFAKTRKHLGVHALLVEKAGPEPEIIVRNRTLPSPGSRPNRPVPASMPPSRGWGYYAAANDRPSKAEREYWELMRWD